jgi:hypothetical protein
MGYLNGKRELNVKEYLEREKSIRRTHELEQNRINEKEIKKEQK